MLPTRLWSCANRTVTFSCCWNRRRFSRNAQFNRRMGGRLSVVSLFLLQVLSKQSGAQREKLSVIGTMHPGSQTTAEAISANAWRRSGPNGDKRTSLQVIGLCSGGQLPVSPDCVFNASLVPETCRDRFVDLKGLIKQVSGESHNWSYKYYFISISAF